MSDERAVIVTDCHRTVWFGYTTEDGRDDTVELVRGRHVYYFEASKGIGQLAESGPGEQSKIGAEIPRMIVHDVATVMDVSSEAEARFAAQGWGGARE